jgi:hypothetical protein
MNVIFAHPSEPNGLIIMVSGFVRRTGFLSFPGNRAKGEDDDKNLKDMPFTICALALGPVRGTRSCRRSGKGVPADKQDALQGTD